MILVLQTATLRVSTPYPLEHWIAMATHLSVMDNQLAMMRDALPRWHLHLWSMPMTIKR